MRLIASAQTFDRRGSNVLRSWIYGLSRDNGFLYCVIVTTAVYALMLPVILLVPKERTKPGGRGRSDCRDQRDRVISLIPFPTIRRQEDRLKK